MKKLTNYHSTFTAEAYDGTRTRFEYQSMSNFSGAAISLEKYIDTLHLSKSEREMLYKSIRNLLNVTVEECFVQFCD